MFSVSVLAILYNDVWYYTSLLALCSQMHIGNLKAVIVEVLTPWKLANAANQDSIYCFVNCVGLRK